MKNKSLKNPDVLDLISLLFKIEVGSDLEIHVEIDGHTVPIRSFRITERRLILSGDDK